MKPVMNLEAIIDDIDTLEPIPQITTQLIEIAQNPDSALKEAAVLITHDATLTANLLRTVNSAHFGLRRRIESVREAVVMLGLNAILDVVLLQATAGRLKAAQAGYDLSAGELWRHAAVSAILARKIAEGVEAGNVNRIFTCALLKDIGKLVLNQYVQAAGADIQRLVCQDAYCFLDAEREVLGIDHAELGGRIAERWNFTPEMAFVIRNHHLPDEKLLDDQAVCIVYLSDCVCTMMGIGTGSDGMGYRFSDPVLERLGYGANGLDQLIMEYGLMKSEIEGLMRSLSLD
jgi:putative nucleotidyltransferase with HDIG domain